MLNKFVKIFLKKIVIGIDAKDGFVAVDGWVKTSKIKTIELAKKLEDYGSLAIIYTDISRDGTIWLLIFEGTKALAKAIKIQLLLLVELHL